ncbi:MAG: DUF1553 domain-containing protein [Pirellulaceae bacterium]|nr:DUF1553 domain-containing protein [Pirellulaceae bacterium]
MIVFFAALWADVPWHHSRCLAEEPLTNPPATRQLSSFKNDVMPVLTKAGCNAGVCHAKAGNGQNGFQLSLLGFEPQEDYEHIVFEGRGRRLFPAAPHESLLLQKATGTVTHGGGARFEVDSTSYRLIHQWIAEGAKYDDPQASTVQAIAVVPGSQTLPPGTEQRLNVIARYSDGSQRDVTPFALFEVNDTSLAEVDSTGQVRTLDLPGKAAVMVRYQGQVAVCNLSIPQGGPIESYPPETSFVDRFVYANLRELGVPASPICDDATFLRRVTLDIAGRLPTLAETEGFLGSSPTSEADRQERRRQLIAQLLRSGEYADFFANKWTAMLKNRRDDASDIQSNFAFFSWVRDSLLANKPYDQMVRELLAATGSVTSNPPVAWYKRVKDPKQQLEDIAQLFLGVRMQCAQCHHHPFERWSQDDYYSLAAFFSQVGRKPTATRGEDMIFHRRGVATANNMKTGIALRPAALGDEIPSIAAETDPRLVLADWMAKPENPFFAKALVNRYWKHFFRRGLIEPEDDIRESNPATNPELLAALEKHFIESGYDLKELVRVITESTAYQLSSAPLPENLNDWQNYSRYYPRRLQAEVLLDSIDQLTGARTDFPNLPTGTRAIALPDNSYNNASPFLKVFGRPENESVCECERIQSSSLAQSLHLMNAADVKAKIGWAEGQAARLAKADSPMEDRIVQLYRLAFSRDPDSDELAIAQEYVTQVPAERLAVGQDLASWRQEGFQDLVWALINTKEFLFNH